MKLGKFFYISFLVGLIIRFGLSYHMGSHDMIAYTGWGRDVLEKGLFRGYYGIYFPLQYQLFALYSWVTLTLGIRWVIIFKGFNLLFGLGVFVLLVKILEKLKVSKYYALIYWLHPWFLLNYSQGFVDIQFSFFILLSIFLLFNSNGKKAYAYICSGIPFAVAFLLKPQIFMPFLALFIFFSLFSLRQKLWKNLVFFVPSFILFIIYSTYFALINFFTVLASHSFSDLAKSFLILPKSYLDTINVMPCLTCSMPNFWYPLAYFLAHGLSVHHVTSRIFIAPNLSIQRVALLAVTTIIIFYCYKLLNSRSQSFGEKILRLVLFVSLLIPFLMTDSHVNHPYLGTLLLIPYLAKYHDAKFKIAVHLLLLALAGYLYVYFGFGENFGAIPSFVRQIPHVIFSLVSIPAFTYILFYLFKTTSAETSQK